MPPIPENSLSGNACVSCDSVAAEAAGRYQAVDVHFEVERLGIDQRQGRKRVRRHNRVGAAEERATRFDDDVGG